MAWSFLRRAAATPALASLGRNSALKARTDAVTVSLTAETATFPARMGAITAWIVGKTARMWNRPSVNAFSQKSAETLCGMIDNLLAIAEKSESYPFLKSDLDATAATAVATRTAISQQLAAVALEKSATQAKTAGKAAAVARLNALATQAYADASLTDAQLAAIGLAPRRSSTPRPAMPQTVTGLAATPATDGTVKLTWNRGANSERTTFGVEESADGAIWTMVAATPRVSLVLGGYAPGTTAYFRVTATNAGASSFPSLPVGVYAPVAPSSVRLRVA